MIPPFQQKVQIELVKLLYQQIKFGLWPETCAAFALFIALYGTINPYLLYGWLISNLLICGLARHLLVYFYHRSRFYLVNENKHMHFWLNLFALGAFLSGVSWGIAGSVMMVHDVAIQRFVVFLIIGITAAANPLYSPVRSVYALFLFPALIPFISWLLLQGQLFSLLGLMSIIYMVIMLATAFYSHNVVATTLRLRFENLGLVDSISQANLSLEQHAHELEKTISKVKATLEATTDGILVVSSKGEIIDFNKKLLDMWSLPRVIIENGNIKKLMVFVLDQLVDRVSFLKRMYEITAEPESESFDELVFKDGRVFESYSRPQRIGERCVGRVWSFRDVTGRKLMEAKLYYQANYDILTGLPNRALVLDRIQQGITYAKQSHLIMAVMFIDLDRFKLINDTLGHTHGDKLLTEIAKRLSNCIRENDTVSRGGGDEFLIVLTALKNESESVEIARKCLDSLQAPLFLEGHKYNCGMSIGISFYPRDGQDAETLIRNADIAMYRAKELGRNNFQFFTEEMNRKVQMRLQIENELRETLFHQQFSLVYQPIVSLKSRHVVGVEALLRWEHLSLGNIPPSSFIPVAEECGMIIKIGEWVLRTACAQAKKWQNQGLDRVQMSINLSARQFRLANIFEQIQRVLSETQLDSRYIALELTESVIMDDVEKNIVILNKMKQMGISIVIDDFGIGYSSLNYLKRLPVDKLKIDKSFVQDIPEDLDDMSITAAIIALATKLNLKVIAEGVETLEQVNFLLAHHCDEIQGYYFSEPLDADKCTRLLSENKQLKYTE